MDDARHGAQWEVYALRYGRAHAYPLSDLVEGEDPEQSHPVSCYFWLLRRGERALLVDTGFTDRRLRERLCLDEVADPVDLLARVGVTPEQVSDIVLTHGHADHTGGLKGFPRARVWMRAAEFAWIRAVLAPLRDLRFNVSLSDYETLLRLALDSRLTLLGNGEEPLVPGVLLVPRGGHTPGSQWVAVRSARGPVILAGDSAYLFRNVEELRPVGAAVSPAENLVALQAMRRMAGERGVVIPGHDPLVATLYPEVAPDVFRLDAPPQLPA